MKNLMVNRLLIILIAIAFVGCNTPNEKIIGRWKIVKNIQNGQEFFNPNPISRDIIREVEFFPNGEYIHLFNGKLAGVGIYKYEIIGDSIFRRNESKEPTDGEIPVIFAGKRYKLTKDTLMLEQDSGWIYLIQNE